MNEKGQNGGDGLESLFEEDGVLDVSTVNLEVVRCTVDSDELMGVLNTIEKIVEVVRSEQVPYMWFGEVKDEISKIERIFDKVEFPLYEYSDGSATEEECEEVFGFSYPQKRVENFEVLRENYYFNKACDELKSEKIKLSEMLNDWKFSYEALEKFVNAYRDKLNSLKDMCKDYLVVHDDPEKNYFRTGIRNDQNYVARKYVSARKYLKIAEAILSCGSIKKFPSLEVGDLILIEQSVEWARLEFLRTNGVDRKYIEYFDWFKIPYPSFIEMIRDDSKLPRKFHGVRDKFINDLLYSQGKHVIPMLFSADDFGGIAHPFGLNENIGYRPANFEKRSPIFSVMEGSRSSFHTKVAPIVFNGDEKVSCRCEDVVYTNLGKRFPTAIFWRDAFVNDTKFHKILDSVQSEHDYPSNSTAHRMDISRIGEVYIDSKFEKSARRSASPLVVLRSECSLIEVVFDKAISVVDSQITANKSNFYEGCIKNSRGIFTDCSINKCVVVGGSGDMNFNKCIFSGGRVELRAGLKFVGCIFNKDIEFVFPVNCDDLPADMFMACDFSEIDIENQELVEKIAKLSRYSYFGNVSGEFNIKDNFSGNDIKERLEQKENIEGFVKVCGDEGEFKKSYRHKQSQSVFRPIDSENFEKLVAKRDLIQRWHEKLNDQDKNFSLNFFIAFLEEYEGSTSKCAEVLDLPTGIFSLDSDFLKFCLESKREEKGFFNECRQIGESFRIFRQRFVDAVNGDVTSFISNCEDAYGKGSVCWPEYKETGDKIVIKGLRNFNVEDCVPNDVEIDITNGELVCIQGPNMEAGKTKLKEAVFVAIMRALMGLPVMAEEMILPKSAMLDMVYCFREESRDKELKTADGEMLTSEMDKRSYYIKEAQEAIKDLGASGGDKRVLLVIDEFMKGATKAEEAAVIEISMLLKFMNAYKGMGVTVSALNVLHDAATVKLLAKNLPRVSCYAKRPENGAHIFDKGEPQDSDPTAALKKHGVDDYYDKDLLVEYLELMSNEIQKKIEVLKGTP